MRGKAQVYVGSGVTERITPAYAGKRVYRCRRLLRVGDHPRLCGEKLRSMMPFSQMRGSPPPMRGKVFHLLVYSRQEGITPAYAGKRLLTICDGNDIEDHPRLCGEKSLTLCTSYNRKGSPPPMRGKAFFTFFQEIVNGITPAYAGKSIRLSSYGLKDWDHPRLCGEKDVNESIRTAKAGSPPPMRGKAQSDIANNSTKGITPAYAGKS